MGESKVRVARVCWACGATFVDVVGVEVDVAGDPVLDQSVLCRLQRVPAERKQHDEDEEARQPAAEAAAA